MNTAELDGLKQKVKRARNNVTEIETNKRVLEQNRDRLAGELRGLGIDPDGNIDAQVSALEEQVREQTAAVESHARELEALLG